MKKKIPESKVLPGHPDFEVLSALAADLTRRAMGRKPADRAGPLNRILPPLYRVEIDGVIRTPLTGRRSYAQLEKVERTYIGMLVEMMLRAELDLPRGQKLDTRLCGLEVDIKHTMGTGWMIPGEAVGHPLILSAADEKTSLCYLGLVVARPNYLRGGQNQDKKTSLLAEAWENILWLYRECPYPPNFWRGLSDAQADYIMAGQSGNERMKRLFRTVQGIPIMRETIVDVAKQKDPTRRLRADGVGGTRNTLLSEGILILSSAYDAPLMRTLGLPDGDFVSYRPQTAPELEAARQAGWPV